MFRVGGVAVVKLSLELLDIRSKFKGDPEFVFARLSVQFFFYIHATPNCGRAQQ